MSKFHVYKITNKINGKIYIGKAKDVEKRWKEHINIANANIKKLVINKAIKKYGKENFVVHTIDSFDTEEEAFAAEEKYIKLFDSRTKGIGYNIAEGGRGGFCGVVPSLEQKEKARENSKKFGKPHSEETKNKLKEIRAKQKYVRLSIELKNQILEMYRTNEYTKQQVADNFNLKYETVNSIIRDGVGKDKFEPYIASEETRNKISEANKGREASEKTKKKLSEARLGKEIGPYSSEHRNKISSSLKEYWDDNKVKRSVPIFTEESMQKCLDASKKRIPDEIKIKIINDYDAGNYTKKQLAEKYNMTLGSIKYITGKCKGIGFIFLTDEEKHEKRAAGQRGKKHTEEHKKKISESNKGKKLSDEAKQKISQKNSGKANGMYGNFKVPLELKKKVLSLYIPGQYGPRKIAKDLDIDFNVVRGIFNWGKKYGMI